MVFCEIDSITEMDNGHRIIIYYIKDKIERDDNTITKLFENTETALELLGKKNDDVLLIEILRNTNKFKQFDELYKPIVTGPITLFAVNNDGIPLICEHICEEVNIFKAIERLSTTCNLNEIPKLGQHFVDTKRNETIIEQFKLFSDGVEEVSPTAVISEFKEAISKKSLSTRLLIRLPNGSKEEVQFDSETTLQELWVTIGARFNISNFDLKTYNQSIFSEDDYEKTLQNLNLCPRGVLIVVNRSVLPFNNNGRIGTIIQNGFYRLLSLPTSVFQYMRGLFFVYWYYIFPSNRSNGNAPRRQVGREIKSSSDYSNQSTSQGTSKRYVPKNTGSNIHTLHRNDDSDDENNRYNGNSTQQK